MIGTLGNAVFQASADKVYTFFGLGRSSNARYEEHAVIAQKPVLELIGPGLEQISFSMRFDVALGINPIEEINRLREARDTGAVLPLTIGGNFLGDWVIEGISEDWRNIDSQGKLLVAIVQVSIKENQLND